MCGTGECDAIVNFRVEKILLLLTRREKKETSNEIVARLRDYTIRGHFYGHDLHFLPFSLSLVSPLFLLTLNRKNKRKCLPVSLYVAGRAHNWNFRHLQMAAPKGTHPLLPSANGETEFFSHFSFFFFYFSNVFHLREEREREKRRRKEGEQSATHREMAVGGGDVGTRRRSVAVWTVRAFRPALGHSRRSHFPSVQ